MGRPTTNVREQNMRKRRDRLLDQARAACDRLVVGLNSDASVRRLKGATRPVQGEAAAATERLSSGRGWLDDSEGRAPQPEASHSRRRAALDRLFTGSSRCTRSRRSRSWCSTVSCRC